MGFFAAEKEIFAARIGISEPRTAGSDRIFVCLEPRQRFAEERQALCTAKKTLFATGHASRRLLDHGEKPPETATPSIYSHRARRRLYPTLRGTVLRVLRAQLVERQSRGGHQV